jgi:hypothetical protein
VYNEVGLAQGCGRRQRTRDVDGCGPQLCTSTCISTWSARLFTCSVVDSRGGLDLRDFRAKQCNGSNNDILICIFTPAKNW